MIQQLPDILPRKFELTPLEVKYNEVMVQRIRTELNIRTQKQNLRFYYSSQTKSDYLELLSERRKIMYKLKRIAKSAGWVQSDLEDNVVIKKQYNRYAPKIYKTKSLTELRQIENLIQEEHYHLLSQTEELLYKLIEQRKKEILK